MNSTQLALRDASEGERAAEVERDLQPATNRFRNLSQTCLEAPSPCYYSQPFYVQEVVR